LFLLRGTAFVDNTLLCGKNLPGFILEEENAWGQFILIAKKPLPFQYLVQ
jgi:hypothetical protein